jgi:hypothetical protein
LIAHKQRPEALASLQIIPRLGSKFKPSDIIQQTLTESTRASTSQWQAGRRRKVDFFVTDLKLEWSSYTEE